MNEGREREGPRLEALILQRIRQHRVFDQAEIAVRVQGRMAYITGCAGGLRQKRLAGEMAAQVEGIGAVVNMLRVAPMIHVDDDTLRERVLNAFAGNWRVDEASILVEVGSGIVHLRGVAKSLAERCACEEEAGATPGVTSVVSEIQLATEKPRSGTDIEREILDGLTECLCISPQLVNVSFQEGVAYLTGTVGSRHSRSAAEELVRWTQSVTDVVNDLVVIDTSIRSERDEPKATMATGPQV